MKKKHSLILTFLLDIFLAATILCVFAYFHHIRYLWGIVDTPTNGDGIVFAPPDDDNNDVNTTTTPIPDDGYDRSGDFGKKFYDRFLKTGEEIISNATEYKSSDISITLQEINTPLYYNDKTYQIQYFVYDIYVRNVENFYTSAVTSRVPLNELMEFAQNEDPSLLQDLAIAAVNGDYWGNANHTQVAVRNGVLLRQSKHIDSDILVMYYDGTMETIHPKDFDFDAIAAKSPYQIWEFGPSLLDESGNALSTKDFDPSSYDSHVIDSRNPRCGVGYYEPGHYCFVMVDGRSSDSDGIRMFQLAEIFEALGCTLAYNMDGGDSAQAYFNGTVIREDEERTEQRKLFDIVCIGEVRKLETS